MPLNAIPIDAVSEEVLQELVEDKERENRSIEFKLSLPGNSYEERKEFLADFTSFANSDGGDLIYGVRAPHGIAEEVVGLSEDLDAETNRLENLLRTGVQPRITGYALKVVQLKNQKRVLVIRIGRSWALPHRVTLSSHDKFYGRNSAGKYALDVPELRSLFSLSESTADRIRNFRAERVSSILAQRTPVSLIQGPRTVIHVIPFNAFGIGQSFDVCGKYDHDFLPILPIASSSGYSFRHNFDGIVTYAVSNNDGPSSSYLQLFRNGTIEAVDTSVLREYDGQIKMVGQVWEGEMLKAVKRFFRVQSDLGVELPLIVMLGLLHVKGAKMHERFFPNDEAVHQEHLLASEALADSFNITPERLLKPTFDSIWNAFGYPRSPSYDESGDWRAQF